MYKLLIVDDEPLVQVGIKSMLNWSELDIEVIGTANNGKLALETIRASQPDIVISDIKMPVMDGLELLRRTREEFGFKKPVFIMLTSYEDFRMAKEAISNQALEYLVKVELNAELLLATMKKAIAQCKEYGNKSTPDSVPAAASHLGPYSYAEKFLISLLNNLFESEEQMHRQASDLNINVDYKAFVCCYGSFEAINTNASSETLRGLYMSSLQMFSELAGKQIPCQSISLDESHFAIILGGDEIDTQRVNELILKIRTSIQNYMNVNMLMGIGSVVDKSQLINESFQMARLSYRQASSDNPVAIISYMEPLAHDTFNISLFKSDLTKAFEEYDSQLLSSTIKTLCELISAHSHHYVQAMDAASNILYLSISLLPDGANVLAEAFSAYPDGYMSLYRMPNVDAVVGWLDTFVVELSKIFDSRKKDYKNRIVIDVKNYVAEHVYEKLSLNDVAALFWVSPSYLSQLFSKYSDVGFNEFVNIKKIQEAKKLLKEDYKKVYEVAEALSFGSEFYFSKVFKKVEGISPSEFLNK